MFLFENFIYDDEWAKKNYGESYKHNNWYLESFLKDDEYYKLLKTLPENEKDRFNFAVNKFYMPNSDSNNFYKIGYGIHYAWKPDPPFQQDQIDFIKRKLSVLGDAVKIIIPHINASMIIQYFIEKDEYRWNKEHARIKNHEDKLSVIEIPEPTLENWLWMINMMTLKKNPRLIFKKFKEDLNQQLEYLVIAYKLKWPGAVNVISRQLYHCFGDGRLVSDNTSQAELYVEATKKYVKTYEIPEEIQEVLDDFNMGSKCTVAVPTKAKYIAEQLDKCKDIKKYSISQYRQSYEYDIILVIYVELTNGNKAYITVSHPNLYMINIYKNIKIEKGSVEVKNEDHIGHTYFSMVNRKRSNHVLNDTFDDFLDHMIETIKNEKMGSI